MSVSNQNLHQPPADEVSIKTSILKIGHFRRYLYTKWSVVLTAMILGAVAGIIYAVYSKPQFTAQCTFVLEDGEKGGPSLGQYSSLASMVGIDVSSGGGLFQGDNIIELYRSRKMISQTLLSKGVFNGAEDLIINRYIKINKLNDAWVKNPRLSHLRFDIPKGQFTIAHDSIIGLVVDNINQNYLTVSKPDKKLTIVSVKVRSTDQLFAKAFTENLVSTVNGFYIQTKTKGIVRNIALLQRQADSVRSKLNSSISGTAAALDFYPDANPTMQSLRVPSQKRQVDVQASGAIYAEVVKNLEIAKSSLQRETPLIQVIDEPVLPLKMERVGKFRAMATGSISTLFLIVVYLASLKVYRGIMS